MQAAGAQDVLTIHRYAHLVGGCRMGHDPETSVVDAEHAVLGAPNLFICDGSVCPTQGSANPALTIMALASRLAERLATRKVDPRGARVQSNLHSQEGVDDGASESGNRGGHGRLGGRGTRRSPRIRASRSSSRRWWLAARRASTRRQAK